MEWGENIDIVAARNIFSTKQRVVVNNALTMKAAFALYRSISYITEKNLWYQSRWGNGRYFDRESSAPKNYVPQANFCYQFDKYPVSNISLDGLVGARFGDSRRPDFRDVLPFGSHPEEELPDGHPLLYLGNFLNSGPCVDVISQITGQKLPEQGTLSFLSRYMSGDFISTHDDGLTDHGGRRIAFVYSLTRDWLPHWGGHTMFMDNNDCSVAEAILPKFNSLVLFSVPTLHAVSTIASFCTEPRYAVTGWFHAKSMAERRKDALRREAKEQEARKREMP